MKASTVVETVALAAAILALQAGILLQGVARPLAFALHEGPYLDRPSFEEHIEVIGPRFGRGS